MGAASFEWARAPQGSSGGRHGVFGGGAEEQFEHGVGRVQLKKGADLSVHLARAALFNEAQAVEFGELGLDECFIQFQPSGCLAGGEGLFGFEQAQALHADGGIRGAR